MMSSDNDPWPRIYLGLPGPVKTSNGLAPTCAEMRKAMDRGSHESALIRQCLQTARHTGMDGEDTYVLLAYQALLHLEDTHRRYTELYMCTAVPPKVTK